MEYLPIQDFTEKWNISKRRIQILCREGRVHGAKMIGNMWAIPEDATRPADARTKNPAISSPLTEESNMRRELKKLLRALFQITEKTDVEETERKTIVLTAIAYSLCAFYLKEKPTLPLREPAYIKKKIYKDISGKELMPIHDEEIVSKALAFLEKYKDDQELDNLLSWSYQYANKMIAGNKYSRTQFFTEKYMIQYLIHNAYGLRDADKIVDPCAGGGNFLVECLELLCSGFQDNQDNSQKTGNDFMQKVISNAAKLYGYDIDCDITRIALVNIRLRALAILNRNGEDVSLEIWDQICPHIFRSSLPDSVCGALATDNRMVVNVQNNDEIGIDLALGGADIVLTNPPFATMKGMLSEQKDFLKKNYPDANCDMCVSFFDSIYKMLKPSGICGIVSQTSWMHLKSFQKIREKITLQYRIEKIANLGSGAFQDLSGEKSNVSLLILGKGIAPDHMVEVLNLDDMPLQEKKKSISGFKKYMRIPQKKINGMNGYDFSEKGTLRHISLNKNLYKDIAVPMQGTSTGNAADLVGYFWEHFGDPEWVSVSNGGGYCRWQGLNDSVVKWGKNGEYIKAQKGSALRNVSYFPVTQMVFSDTGTAGLNVRTLLDHQIFIASGPGIRITKGNKYAHLALLNSRLAAYCIRLMSPKLTIAAGYIGQLPVAGNICSSVVLEKNARLCIELKQKILSARPNNLEYDSSLIKKMPDHLMTAAWGMLNEDITNELLKLQIEGNIDRYVMKEYGLSKEDETQLAKCVGECAYFIDGGADVDLNMLDQYIARLTDASCCLKRTKTSKSSLGSDGILEYASKDLNIHPEIIVRRIQENPFAMKITLKKYRTMLLHNAMLYYMGYNTSEGISHDNCKADAIAVFLADKFGDGPEYRAWIEESFCSAHNDIFKGVPYLTYRTGEIQKYDHSTAG